MRYFWVILGVITILYAIGELKKDKAKSLDRHSARIIAESEVKKLLKSPKTAIFSNLRETSIIEISKDEWQVIGFVHSSNSFGAEIKSKYECTVFLNDKTIMVKDLKIFN